MKILYEQDTYPGTAWKTKAAKTRSTGWSSYEQYHSHFKSDKSRTSFMNSMPVVGSTPTLKSARVVSAPARVLLSMVILTSLVMSYCTIPPIPEPALPAMVKRGSGWKIVALGNSIPGCATESGRLTRGRGQHAAVKMNQRNAIAALELKSTDTHARHQSGKSDGSPVRIPVGCLRPPLTQTSESKLGNPHRALAAASSHDEKDIRKPMGGKAPGQAKAHGNAWDMPISRLHRITDKARGAPNE